MAFTLITRIYRLCGLSKIDSLRWSPKRKRLLSSKGLINKKWEQRLVEYCSLSNGIFALFLCLGSCCHEYTKGVVFKQSKKRSLLLILIVVILKPPCSRYPDSPSAPLLYTVSIDYFAEELNWVGFWLSRFEPGYFTSLQIQY